MLQHEKNRQKEFDKIPKNMYTIKEKKIKRVCLHTSLHEKKIKRVRRRISLLEKRFKRV